jgi:hypothetical protein
MLICAFFFLLAIGLAILAGEYFYRERFLLGAAALCGGWLLAGGSLGLLWLTYYPSTWGWPI